MEDVTYETEFKTKCIYCGAILPAEDASGFSTVPEVDDNEGWAQETAMHATPCEWCSTRAHQKFDQGNN